jgi:hypothetical protein
MDHIRRLIDGVHRLSKQGTDPIITAANALHGVERSATAGARCKRSRFIPVLLLILVSICVLWLRSYRRADLIACFVSSGRVQAIASIDGSLFFVGTSIVTDPEHAWSLQWESTNPAYAMQQSNEFGGADSASHLFAGLGVESGTSPVEGLAGRWVVLRIPYWLPVLSSVLLLIPAVCRQWTRRQRRKTGRCLHCGYDMRGGGTRCPECGRAS